MVSFIGEYSARIDDKGRIVFPSAFKAQLPPENMELVIKKSLYSPCLEVYTLEEWQRRSSEVRSKLNFFDPDDQAFWRTFTDRMDAVLPDAKLGRIAISRKLLNEIGADKEVVFSGNDFMIEIWAKEKFENSRLPQDKFITIAKSLSKR